MITSGSLRKIIMTTINLDKLTTQIDALINTCEHLKIENNHLRTKQNQLIIENEALTEKNHLAKAKLAAMLDKLRSLELAHE